MDMTNIRLRLLATTRTTLPTQAELGIGQDRGEGKRADRSEDPTE
jgi:hypothetical protein